MVRAAHASVIFKLGAHPKIVQERLGHSSIENEYGSLFSYYAGIARSRSLKV